MKKTEEIEKILKDIGEAVQGISYYESIIEERSEQLKELGVTHEDIENWGIDFGLDLDLD